MVKLGIKASKDTSELPKTFYQPAVKVAWSLGI